MSRLDIRDINRNALYNCFKHGCGNMIRTWECKHAELNGLCLQHAERPEKIGTLRKPTHVSEKDK